MPRGESLDPVEVRVECSCAHPHPDGDVIYLHPKLTLQGGQAALEAYADGADLSTSLISALVRHQVKSWNLTDPEGKPVEVTPANVELYLPWNEGGMEVAAAAAKQYIGKRGSPFYSKSSTPTSAKASKPGQTGGSTSRTRRSSSKPQTSSTSP